MDDALRAIRYETLACQRSIQRRLATQDVRGLADDWLDMGGVVVGPDQGWRPIEQPAPDKHQALAALGDSQSTTRVLGEGLLVGTEHLGRDASIVVSDPVLQEAGPIVDHPAVFLRWGAREVAAVRDAHGVAPRDQGPQRLADGRSRQTEPLRQLELRRQPALCLDHAVEDPPLEDVGQLAMVGRGGVATDDLAAISSVITRTFRHRHRVQLPRSPCCTGVGAFGPTRNRRCWETSAWRPSCMHQYVLYVLYGQYVQYVR